MYKLNHHLHQSAGIWLNSKICISNHHKRLYFLKGHLQWKFLEMLISFEKHGTPHHFVNICSYTSCGSARAEHFGIAGSLVFHMNNRNTLQSNAFQSHSHALIVSFLRLIVFCLWLRLCQSTVHFNRNRALRN